MQTLEINGETYVRQADVPAAKPNGNRYIVVVDSGWVFAGDVTDEGGRVKITRAVHVLRWAKCWFDGMIENPTSDSVELAVMKNDIDVPAAAELFRVQVSENWGL